ncbi:MAG: DHHA1 domain-containing protein, partial [Bacilli bacterium]|nr:DHHA1 domain-containing protein [Bacilli bacterium]
AANEKNLLAGNIVKLVTKELNGSGGGRNDLASGAGKNKDNIEHALKVALDEISK